MNLANIDNKFKTYDINKNLNENSMSMKQTDSFSQRKVNDV
jgi:hypothetical protein